MKTSITKLLLSVSNRYFMVNLHMYFDTVGVVGRLGVVSSTATDNHTNSIEPAIGPRWSAGSKKQKWFRKRSFSLFCRFCAFVSRLASPCKRKKRYFSTKFNVLLGTHLNSP